MAASTEQLNNFPKFVELTAAGPDVARAYSWMFAPCREFPFIKVVTPVRSVTPMVALAVFDPSAKLVAVRVTTPAVAGAVNVTGLPDVLVVGLKEPPPTDDQVTP